MKAEKMMTEHQWILIGHMDELLDTQFTGKTYNEAEKYIQDNYAKYGRRYKEEEGWWSHNKEE